MRRVAAAFAAFERDRDGVLAELGALETELAAPRAAALDPLPALDPGPDEVRHHVGEAGYACGEMRYVPWWARVNAGG